MPLPFETVREKLLRAGIAPRHAARYVTELREHLSDLTERERASGLSDRQATERALSIVGSDTQLAQAMIDKGPARAMAARAPWAVFAVSPIVLFAAAIWAMASSLMHLHAVDPTGFPENYLDLVGAVGIAANYLLGPLLAAACIVMAVRQRLNSAWVWCGLALIAIFSGMFGIHMHVMAPGAGQKGYAAFSAAAVVYRHGHVDSGATTELVMLRAGVLFLAAAFAYIVLRSRTVASAQS